MNIGKITKIEATCFDCGTKVTITESKFREICNHGLTCPACQERISNSNFAAEYVLQYNHVANELEKELDSYDNIRIY
ncbi:hypothetical protein NFZ15_016975 [Clostridioides difficile]|uniref:hypothetical protein n=1 Tax=Clostridioides difficile TaxID=1496 RepID=UPI00097FD9C3|nr:hypothetical protein [Clostridioides difficile]EGT3655155.1 hypothetical protein [Clostridioides difficile]MBY2733965.1 hypothetical protein [Clostridioides difficile]MCE4906732.1 hypothetical protein [Clostridioides difficile]MCO4409199.1 hypothetical protein [Clostridioides difficile]QQY53377.1 hypothetical protein JMW52_18825 [Clostridioides difficile]